MSKEKKEISEESVESATKEVKSEKPVKEKVVKSEKPVKEKKVKSEKSVKEKAVKDESPSKDKIVKSEKPAKETPKNIEQETSTSKENSNIKAEQSPIVEEVTLDKNDSISKSADKKVSFDWEKAVRNDMYSVQERTDFEK